MSETNEILSDEQELIELSSKLKTNLEIKDRKYLLKKYPNCFVGNEAVTYMVNNNITTTRQEAVDLGKRLVAANIIRHVTKHHNFKDENKFYLFVSDAPSHEPISPDTEFTPEQQHNIIMKTLSDMGKGSECFQMRWKPNSDDYLTGEILLQTPMFWFMKYKWSRQEIETLFYKAHIVITWQFDSSLKCTFGGDPGPRWKGGGGLRKKKKKIQKKGGRDWNGLNNDNKKKADDNINHNINHPNFEYKPVHQEWHFQATGGVNNKNKDETNKIYSKPEWENKTGNESVIIHDDESVATPTGNATKLNDFLDDIYGEIKDDESKKEDENENENDIYGEIKDENENELDNEHEMDESDQIQLESFLDSFSQSELDDIEKETKSLSHLLSPKKRGSQKNKKHKGSKSITTRITTGRLSKPESDIKLKRWSGGLNIHNKANTLRLIQKSNTLRHEKAKLKAINDATSSKSSTNITKLKF